MPAFEVSIEASEPGDLVLVDETEGIYNLDTGAAPTVKVTAAEGGSLDGWKVYYKDLAVDDAEDAEYTEMKNASLKVTEKGSHKIECYIEKDGLTSQAQTISFTNMVDPDITFSAPVAQDYTGKPADTETLGATSTAGAEITYQFYSDAEAANEIDVPVNAGTYYVKAFVAKNIEEGILAGSSEAVAFTINPVAEEKVTYNGEAAALKVLLSDGTEAAAEKLTKKKLTKQGSDTELSEAKDAGTYTYEVKYEDTGVVGYASKTFVTAHSL